jgi:hypothetical protein
MVRGYAASHGMPSQLNRNVSTTKTLRPRIGHSCR